MKFVIDIQCNPTMGKQLLADMLQGIIRLTIADIEDENVFREPVRVKPMPVKRKKKSV